VQCANLSTDFAANQIRLKRGDQAHGQPTLYRVQHARRIDIERTSRPRASIHCCTRSDLEGPCTRGAAQFLGDDWRHRVKLEALVDADAETIYPRLLSAHGRCPPEDIGGPWGYAQFLEAMSDPNHERHADLIEWRGPDFDPKTVDEVAIQKRLTALARRSRAKPKAVASP
jgi:Plasmid pRiA4b ORF-3-like protein